MPETLYSMIEDEHGNVYLGISTSGSGGSFTYPNLGPNFSSSDFILYKMDSEGNNIWDKRYGGSGIDGLFHLTLTESNGVILTGKSNSPISGNKTEANLTGVEIWVLAVDSNGTVLWDKTIHNAGTNFEIYGATFATEDGCYTTFEYTNSGIGGYKSQANWDTTNAATDIWAIQYCFDTISGFTNNYGYALVTPPPQPRHHPTSLSQRNTQHHRHYYQPAWASCIAIRSSQSPIRYFCRKPLPPRALLLHLTIRSRAQSAAVCKAVVYI
jgi:hypothetical protein